MSKEVGVRFFNCFKVSNESKIEYNHNDIHPFYSLEELNNNLKGKNNRILIQMIIDETDDKIMEGILSDIKIVYAFCLKLYNNQKIKEKITFILFNNSPHSKTVEFVDKFSKENEDKINVLFRQENLMRYLSKLKKKFSNATVITVYTGHGKNDGNNNYQTFEYNKREYNSLIYHNKIQDSLNPILNVGVYDCCNEFIQKSRKYSFVLKPSKLDYLTEIGTILINSCSKGMYSFIDAKGSTFLKNYFQFFNGNFRSTFYEIQSNTNVSKQKPRICFKITDEETLKLELNEEVSEDEGL